MLMLADKGGVENRQNSADIVYGRPLILYIPLLENRQAVSFRIFVMLSIDFQKNHHKIPILSMLCTLFLGGLYLT